MALNQNLTLAGIDPRSPVLAGFIPVPGTIFCDDDAIRWKSAPPGHERGPDGGKIIGRNGRAKLLPAYQEVKPDPRLLEKFYNLHNASPGEIVAFARKHSVLGWSMEGFRPSAYLFGEGIEPAAEWRKLASEVRSILNLTQLLATPGSNIRPEDIAGAPPPECNRDHPPNPASSDGSPWPTLRRMTLSAQRTEYVCLVCRNVQRRQESDFGPISEWAKRELLTNTQGEIRDYPEQPGAYFWRGKLGTGRKPFPRGKEERANVARECLDDAVQRWLIRFPAPVFVERKRGELAAVLDYSFGLLSAISLQLMQTVAGKTVQFCAQCRNVFIWHRGSGPEQIRMPRSDRDIFCEECKVDRSPKGSSRVINRRAEARRREKKIAARKLYARGVDPAAIATELAVRKPETIQSWAKQGHWENTPQRAGADIQIGERNPAWPS